MARINFCLALMLMLAGTQLWPGCLESLTLQLSATFGFMATNLGTVQVSLQDSVLIVREIASLLGTLEEETGKVFQVFVHLSCLADAGYSAFVAYLWPMHKRFAVLATTLLSVQEYIKESLLVWRSTIQDSIWGVLESYPTLGVVQAVWCNLGSPLPVSRDVTHLITLFILWLCYYLYGHQFRNSRELKRKISLGFWMTMLKNPMFAVLAHNLVILPLSIKSVILYLIICLCLSTHLPTDNLYLELFTVTVILLLLLFLPHASVSNQLFVSQSRLFLFAVQSQGVKIILMLFHFIAVVWSFVQGDLIVCAFVPLSTNATDYFPAQCADNSGHVTYAVLPSSENPFVPVSPVRDNSALVVLFVSTVFRIMYQ